MINKYINNNLFYVFSMDLDSKGKFSLAEMKSLENFNPKKVSDSKKKKKLFILKKLR